MDIEVVEHNIICDLGNNLSLVKSIFIEYHSHINPPQKLDEISLILRKNNFNYFLESGYLRPDNPFISRKEIDGIDNLINII